MLIQKASGEYIAKYTEEERRECYEMSLTQIARSMGFTPIRCGSHFKIKEMDSLIISHDKTWKRYSGKGNITSGSQIDFVMEFAGIDSVPEAVNYLLNLKGSTIDKKTYVPVKIEETERKEMVLPPKNKEPKRVFAYLTRTRCLSSKIVFHFLDLGLIYEDSVHHNIVYCGKAPDGNIKYAGMRGIADIYGKKFKCDVLGNNKAYGVNIVNKESVELKVFEAVIDLMSYMDITGDYTSNKLVLGMVEDTPLIQFLKDYDHIKSITFCLDGDEAGWRAMIGDKGSQLEKRKKGYALYYQEQGYDTAIEGPSFGKDWNEYLVAKKTGTLPKDKELVQFYRVESPPLKTTKKETIETEEDTVVTALSV